jgi:N-acetylglucosamine kinase-like BadF-type ATPase
MAYFLAIDAGGTKAEYALADDRHVLGRAVSGTIKRMRTTAEIATENLSGALDELTALTGVSLSEVKRTCVGTAGNTVPLVTDWLRTELGRRVGGELLLLGDVEIALDAAFPGGSGILVLAGTGSNVAGRSAAGVMVGAGGYGPVLSDQGSGHRIGSEALRELFLAIDEERPTLLLEAILAHWRLTSTDALVAHANTCQVSEFSSLVPVVLACADAGDAAAQEVLRRQGEELAHLALLLHRRLERLNGAAWHPRFAFASSILQHVRPVRQALTATLERELGSLEIPEGVVDALNGAVWRARRVTPL